MFLLGLSFVLILLVGFILIFYVFPHITLIGPTVIVTRSQYDQISEGMTYEQAVAIIGHPGNELSRNDLGGFQTVMYSWRNSDGSNMNAMFQNDRLISKAQFGLPDT